MGMGIPIFHLVSSFFVLDCDLNFGWIIWKIHNVKSKYGEEFACTSLLQILAMPPVSCEGYARPSSAYTLDGHQVHSPLVSQQ